MTTLFKRLAVVAALCIGDTSFADGASQPVSVIVHTDQVIVKSGQPIYITIVITGESSAISPVFTTGDNRAVIAIKVKTPDGSSVYYNNLRPGSHRIVDLRSGDVMREGIDLAGAVDMSRSGGYVIEVGAMDPDLHVLAWSSPLDVNVAN